jgi:DNA-directed RNA polymerase specialized sigma24 family protein
MSEIPTQVEDSAPIESGAVEALSRRFRPALIGYFRRRIKDAAEAEDLAQEVFLRMLRRGNVSGLDDVRAYLFETASSVLVDRSAGVCMYREAIGSLSQNPSKTSSSPTSRLRTSKEGREAAHLPR